MSVQNAVMSGADKPKYAVPSMKDIKAIKWNGYNVISTFSGCGGSSLGYRMAGYRVLLANEFIPAARESYAANSKAILDPRDIREVKGSELLEKAGLKVGELDILDGSPPCASFSTAGKRQKGWGTVKKYSDSSQRTDDLFFQYSRLIREMKPKVFVAENVSGLVKGSAKGYFKEILKELKDCGYKVSCRVLDAKWLGVPQSRQRTIFIGVREDLKLNPVHPSPLSYQYSISDACPWILKVVHDTSGLWSTGEITNRTSPTITVGVNGVNSRHFQVLKENKDESKKIITESHSDLIIEKGACLKKYATGKEWKKLKQGQSSDKYFNLVRSSLDKPCQTVTAMGGSPGCASVSHPTECRKFSIQELKRICGFPDDFVLKGDYVKQWERLGRSVPPVMMSHIAQTIHDEILTKVTDENS